MIKYTIMLVAALAFVSSCGSDKKEETITTGTADSLTAIDTEASLPVPEIKENPELEAIVNLFEKDKSLPFSINSKQIDDFKGKTELNGMQVKLITTRALKNSLFPDLGFALQGFYVIDSVKQKGTYDAWVEGLDLGQVRTSNVYPVFKMETGVSSWILFWMIDEATVEACPYAWTKSVYATIIDRNEVKETFLFAEHSGSSDAPISFERIVNGQVKEDLTFSLSLTEELDENEPKVEITEGNYEMKLFNGEFSFTKEEKKKPRMVKRKEEA